MHEQDINKTEEIRYHQALSNTPDAQLTTSILGTPWNSGTNAADFG